MFAYIFRYSKFEQIMLLVQTLISFPFLYYSLDLPKTIINKAIGGKEIPAEFLGIQVDQIVYLFILCGLFLALVFINGAFKYYNNVYKGIVSERMLRRFRFQLIQRVMRFPLPQFRKMSQGEIVAMIASETEPLGGFIGDALAVPAFQGGTLLVIIGFMFVQDWVLGLAAISLYPMQGYIIPKLQARVNRLSKERVRRMRNLSDRIGSLVQGAGEIHAHDTSRYELTDFTERQGIIYWIRVDIYNKKFAIKFINNFLAQLTPFFFYSIGGYLVIAGNLSLGALVAVLAAYKDMTSPWKELLTYYQQFQDIRIKYEQLVEQFEPAGLLDEKLQTVMPDKAESLVGDLAVSNLVWEDEGTKVINGANLVTKLPRHIAVIGSGSGGKEEFSKLISRQIFPTSGRISIGGRNFSEIPEAATGRSIAYVGADSYIIGGTVRDNLLYGLKHLPLRDPDYDEQKQSERKKVIDEAVRAGSFAYDINADWVDYAAAGCNGPEEIGGKMVETLALVDLEEDVFQMGLRRTIEPERNPALVDAILRARAALRKRLQNPDYAALVETFDKGRYNSNASVAENILFGTPVGPTFAIDSLGMNPHVLRVLDSLDLTGEFLEKGRKLAEMMVELFKDLPPGHEYFERFSFITSDDLPEFQAILRRIDSMGCDKAPEADRAHLLALPFKLVEARHHLDLLDGSMQARLLEARWRFAETLPAELRGAVQFFDPEAYNAASSVMDNILFGKVASDKAQSLQRVGRLISDVIDELGLRGSLTEAGFGYDVGIAGSRLTVAQRQKLALARGLIKKPDVLVVNQAIGSLEAAVQRGILSSVQEVMRGRTLIWVAGQEAPAGFDQVVAVEGGKIIDHSAPAPAQPVAVVAAPAEEAEAGGFGKQIELLNMIPLFSGLDRSKLKFLAFTAGRVTYETGQTVFRQGDMGDNAYVILEGEVEVVLATPDGDKVLGVIGKSEVFGELALLSDAPRTATIRAKKALTVLTISKELFVGLINEDAAIGAKVIRAVARRFEGTMTEYSRAKVMFDSITALPTMSLFLDRYLQSVAQFKRVGSRCALLVFSLDVPPSVHIDADSQAYREVLQGIVSRLKTCVRDTDTIGLLDHFQFGFIMNGIENEQAPDLLAKRIVKALSEPICAKGVPIEIRMPIQFRYRACEASDTNIAAETISDLVRGPGARTLQLAA